MNPYTERNHTQQLDKPAVQDVACTSPTGHMTCMYSSFLHYALS